MCGGRNYANRQRVQQELVAERPDVVINGGASGADFLAASIALDSGIPTITMPAAWATHGSRAGFLRNGWMLKYANPTHVLAFKGGAGTADMVAKARAAGIPVREVQE